MEASPSQDPGLEEVPQPQLEPHAEEEEQHPHLGRLAQEGRFPEAEAVEEEARPQIAHQGRETQAACEKAQGEGHGHPEGFHDPRVAKGAGGTCPEVKAPKGGARPLDRGSRGVKGAGAYFLPLRALSSRAFHSS